MESVDFFDKHLDPHDYPTHSACSVCGKIFDNDDLNQFNDDLFCDECLLPENKDYD